MRAVIQRVKEAQVKVAGQTVGQINRGLLIFLAVARDDNKSCADYLVNKITQLRIFEDDHGKMNVSVLDIAGQCLVVSQFTLYGNCHKGRRPSFDEAADPVKGEELYNYFVVQLKASSVKVETGKFKAMMEVALTNDGPVTFILDSQ